MLHQIGFRESLQVKLSRDRRAGPVVGLLDANPHAERFEGESCLPEPSPRVRPRRWPLREILDGNFSIVRTEAQWRALPHEYPP